MQEEGINKESIRAIMHPEIIAVAFRPFGAGLYASAVEAAFKAVEVMVRRSFVEKGGDGRLHGVKLMEEAFSSINRQPILEFASSSEYSDAGIQEGYKMMFKGSMMAIRNPKAHANEIITKEDALRKLAFASMLMYKYDTIIK